MKVLIVFFVDMNFLKDVFCLMIVVGFGDMFGKIILLVDWEIFCRFVDELYLEVGVKFVKDVFW